jgi:hypothetical protein
VLASGRFLCGQKTHFANDNTGNLLISNLR